MKIRIVSDASPLIYFAKLDEIALLSKSIGPVAAPPAVIQESVSDGKKRHRPDADRIHHALEDGLILPLELSAAEKAVAQTLHSNSPLGAGECEVIACAFHRSAKALLSDKKARSVAIQQGIQTINTTDILFFALLRHQISLQTFKRVIRSLAVITGINAATLMEQEAIADEIAYQLNIKE